MEKIETNSKAPKFKVNGRVRITKYKNVFSKGYSEIWLREIFTIDFVLKTNPWTYKLKDLNWQKIIESFYEKKNCFWVHSKCVQTVMLEVKST